MAALAKELKKKRGKQSIQHLAAATLATSSLEAFKWGDQAIMHAMGSGYNDTADCAEFKQKQWQPVRLLLAKKRRALDK